LSAISSIKEAVLFGINVRRGMLAVAILAAVLGAAAGGIAYAETSGGSTPTAYNACAKSVGGQLRLDNGTGCANSEQALRLGGPAHVDEWAWFGGVDGGQPIVSGVWPDIRGHETTVLTFHLDKGQYLVSTELIAINNGGQGVVVCQTGNAHLGTSLAQAAVGNTAGFALQQTMQEQAVFDADAPQDLSVDCFNAPPNDPAGNPRINLVEVTATRIDSSTSNGVTNP
jgi:hypothetical protein